MKRKVTSYAATYVKLYISSPQKNSYKREKRKEIISLYFLRTTFLKKNISKYGLLYYSLKR